jgi:hypothetical protein
VVGVRVMDVFGAALGDFPDVLDCQDEESGAWPEVCGYAAALGSAFQGEPVEVVEV